MVEYDKNILYRLYWVESKTLKQIAVIYNVSKSTMFLCFKKLNIPTRPRGENSKINNYRIGKKMTAEQIEHNRLSHMGLKQSKEAVNKRRITMAENRIKRIHNKISTSVKKLWENEEYRNKIISARNKVIDNVEFSENMSKKLRVCWQNPEYVKKQMQSRHVAPNKTELKFLDIINSTSPQPFKYVGDGQLIIAGKCPDYVCETNDKLLVEFYGDYWHRGENPEERITLFAEKGYKTLVIWEKELKNLAYIKNKLLSFVGV